MEPTFIQWVEAQGGLAAVAALALWMLNQFWKVKALDSREWRDQERGDKLLLIKTLGENTKALTELIEVTRRLNGKP